MKEAIKWLFKIGWRKVSQESWIGKSGGIWITNYYKNKKTGEIRRTTIPPGG
jgi:hypothetical protein